MANPVKGELALEISGKRYRFVLGTYALAALERRLSMKWPDIMAKAVESGFGIDETLAVFHSGLMRHHDMTEREASDLLDQYTIQRFADLFIEAVKLMMPEEGSSVEDPPTAAANGRGTGLSATG